MIAISGLPETQGLYSFPSHEGWRQTALRVLKLVVLLIPCLVRDFFRQPEVRVENGNTLVKGFQEQHYQICVVVLPIVQAYLGEEHWGAFDFLGQASPMLKGCKLFAETTGCLTWAHWKQDQQLRTRRLGSPVPELNLHSISVIDLTGCDDQGTELLGKFESLAGKTLRLPEIHAVAHGLIERHADKIAVLAEIDIGCDIFDGPRTFDETARLLEAQSPKFTSIRFSSTHTSCPKLPVETMRRLIHKCPKACVVVNPLPFYDEQARNQFVQQFSGRSIVWMTFKNL